MATMLRHRWRHFSSAMAKFDCQRNCTAPRLQSTPPRRWNLILGSHVVFLALDPKLPKLDILQFSNGAAKRTQVFCQPRFRPAFWEIFNRPQLNQLIMVARHRCATMMTDSTLHPPSTIVQKMSMPVYSVIKICTANIRFCPHGLHANSMWQTKL